MTAKDYLNEKGINLMQTALFVVIDEAVRQPDLCYLMEEYAKIKVEEYKQSNLTAEKE